MIELRALGTAEIHTESAIITPSQQIVFATALYLIVERGKPLSRMRLSSLLWSAASPVLRSHRLRQTLYQLKKLGINAQADRNEFHLRRSDARIDFDDLEKVDVDGSISDINFEFLPGYDPSFSQPYQEWLDAVRGEAHAILTQRLLSSLREARNAGRWADVDRISGRCLRLDNYNEAAVLARAEAHAMRGQKLRAVSLLDQYLRELSPSNPSLAVPATLLRRRVLQNEDRRSPTQSGAHEPDFVGRGPEMAILTHLLADARKGAGGACLIYGEPGIGKTRLSAEIARFADLQGHAVERIGCKRSDTDQPLSAFVALVPRLRELPGALGCSRTTLTWLRRLTDFDTTTQAEDLPAEDSATLYTHLRFAVFDLLDAVSDEASLCIVLEDIQWLDSASAKLLAAVLDSIRTKRIFFLFNSRELLNPLTESIPADHLRAIHLKPLADHDALTLVRKIVPENRIAVDRLVCAADGNPYFLQELAKHWMEGGQPSDVPSSIASVLDERLSRLSDVARQLLQASAVLAEHSNLERLESLLEYAPSDLLAGIQELSTSGMLRSSPLNEAPAQNLFIRHDLLSIQVLNTLTPSGRAYLHRRCALVLEREALRTSMSTSLMRSCAFHWYHSGDSERAYELALRCADHLLEIGLAADAAKSFEAALGFCSTVQKQSEVLSRMVQASRMAKDLSAVLATIPRLRTLQEPSSSGTHHDDLEIIEFEALRTTQADIVTVFSRTLACVYDPFLSAAHRVSAAAVAAKLATAIPDLPELERVYLSVSHLVDDSTVEVRSRLQMQVIYNTMCGDLRAAVQFARHRLAYERVEGTSSLLINALTDMAYVLRRTGTVEEMAAVLEEGYHAGINHKNYAAARDCAERLASILEDADRPGVDLWMKRAIDGSGDARDIHADFALNANLTRIALRENRLGDARKLLERGFDWEWLRPRRGWLAAGLGLWIRLLVAENGKPGEVRAKVDELRQVCEATANLGGQDYEISALCLGLIFIGEMEQAKSYVENYVRHKRRDLTELPRELRKIWRDLCESPLGSLAPAHAAAL